MSLTRVLRQDIAPVGSAYLFFLIVFVRYALRRRDAPERSGSRPPMAVSPSTSWAILLRRVAGRLMGGYLVFALIIAVFYLVLGAQSRNFVPQSLAQGSVLAFGVVLPAFLLLTWVEVVWRRRRR
jgi:hypothetical protein